jgi:hypothetical protein
LQAPILIAPLILGEEGEKLSHSESLRARLNDTFPRDSIAPQFNGADEEAVLSFAGEGARATQLSGVDVEA